MVLWECRAGKILFSAGTIRNGFIEKVTSELSHWECKQEFMVSLSHILTGKRYHLSKKLYFLEKLNFTIFRWSSFMIPLWFYNHTDPFLSLSGVVIEKVPLILLALSSRLINVQAGAV